MSTDIVERIWARDHTVWKPEPAEIADRLGWLDVMDEMRARADELRAFAREVHDEGVAQVVLLGMGGSSLAPEVMRDTFGSRVPFTVLDTTHPAAVQRTLAAVDPDRTVFVVASKSGTTVETLSHLALFASVAKPERFVAITDPGTPLAARATSDGFRRTFLNPPDIGGRYSALSYFGLVPAALMGVDLDALLEGAQAMAALCRSHSDDNPGLELGLALGEGARDGRDKCTVLLPDALSHLGVWIEQLIAESTGKEGIGIVPVVDEPVGSHDGYGHDRVFVAYGERAVPGEHVVHLPHAGARDLGAEFFRWEFATAVAGAILGINPFDQPDVEDAKRAARAALEREPDAVPFGDAGATLGSVGEGDYIALQAFIEPTQENAAALDRIRRSLRDSHRVAVTAGFGPRFLHSTGQLHKGGPDTVVCVQIADGARDLDVEIPGESYTFGRLLDAQAFGDLNALRGRGRRVVRTTLDALKV